MIISHEQVRRALEYLQTTECGDAAPCPGDLDGLTPELLERVRDIVAATPDMRDDRIAQARAELADGVSSDDVAEKMIGRIISDSLR